MTFTSCRHAVAVAVAVGALALPAGASAKGGKDTPPPPNPSPTVLCDYSLDGPTDGGTVFSNQVGDAGCLSVLATTSTLRLSSVQVTRGWTYEVTSDGEGSNNRVAVDFNNIATGQRMEARIESGKTVIR